jgi:hypothetical protein
MDPGSPMVKKDKDLDFDMRFNDLMDDEKKDKNLVPLFNDLELPNYSEEHSSSTVNHQEYGYAALLEVPVNEAHNVFGVQFPSLVDERTSSSFEENSTESETQTEETHGIEEDEEATKIEANDWEIGELNEIIDMDFILQSIANPNETITQDFSPLIDAQYHSNFSYTHCHKCGKHGEYKDFGYYSDPSIRVEEKFILLFRKFNEIKFYDHPPSIIGSKIIAVIEDLDIRDNENHIVRVLVEAEVIQGQNENLITLQLENLIPNNNNNNNNNNHGDKKKGRGGGVLPNVFLLRLYDEIGLAATFYIFAYRRTRGIPAGMKKAKKYISELYKPKVS